MFEVIDNFMMATRFIIKDKLINFNWKITNETKEIGKYISHKAIGEYYYIPKGTTNYANLNKAIDTTNVKEKLWHGLLLIYYFNIGSREPTSWFLASLLFDK